MLYKQAWLIMLLLSKCIRHHRCCIKYYFNLKEQNSLDLLQLSYVPLLKVIRVTLNYVINVYLVFGSRLVAVCKASIDFILYYFVSIKLKIYKMQQ